MRSGTRLSGRKTRRELVMLFAASFATAISLTAAIVAGQPGSTLPGARLLLGTERLMLIGLIGGLAVAAAIVIWRIVAQFARVARRAQAETQALRARLAQVEAVHLADAQVLLLSEHGGALTLVTHALDGVPGLPRREAELLCFATWLEPTSADALKRALDRLFLEGRAFDIIVKTLAGGHLEAHGRAAGARAVLRLKDVAGYKRDLGRIIDQHLSLARDIRACRALLDALPMPVWLKSREGRLEWVNKAYAAAVEVDSEAEVVERQIELLDSRQRKSVETALEQKQVYRDRIHLVADGTRKAHDLVVLPLEDAVAGAALDVTAVETAKGELDRQVAAYDRTLDHVSTAVAIFNREKRLTFFNEAYRKLWQIDAAWLETGPDDGAVLDRLKALGRLPEVAKYPEWKQKLIARYATGTPLDEWWHLPGDRMLRVISELRPDGGLTYLYVDDTERIAQEGKYNALIRVQRETLDSLKEGVAVFSTDGRLELFNSAFARIWRLSPALLGERPHVEELIQQLTVLCDDTQTWAQIRRAVTAFNEAREPIDGQMVRPDQSVIDYASTPLPDGATLLTFADVTDSKRYERALEERNEALVVADRLKNQFIGHVSYELRTPLTTIIGFSELLASPHFGELNERQREYLEDITSSSKTLLAIIDDILDLTTIDAGAMELKLATVEVEHVVDSAIRAVSERAARAGLTLDIAVEPGTREFVADEERVRQVLYNLLSNAVGFSHQGGTVRLSCWREDGGVVFLVEDDGVGIPKDQQARVFDRFESRSQGSKHRGAGLGLSIVKSLVELHGGETALVSEPGRGTRVAVRFPERGLRGTAPGAKTAAGSVSARLMTSRAELA